MENPIYKWMITRGVPAISGNPIWAFTLPCLMDDAPGIWTQNGAPWQDAIWETLHQRGEERRSSHGEYNDLTSRPNPGNHGLFEGNHPQMAARFRLVKYCNLPIYIYTHIIVYDIYSLVICYSLPWKDPPFFSSVNHLFLWAIPHGYVKLPEGIYIWKDSRQTFCRAVAVRAVFSCVLTIG